MVDSRTRSAARWWVLAIGATIGATPLGGCSIADVEIVGKRCPCPEPEYVCDTQSNTCTTGAGCTPRFTVEGFSATWATTRNIRWQWEPLGAEADFGSYAIEISRDAKDILSGNPEIYLDGEIHGELGFFRQQNTHEREVNKASVSYALDHSTTWHARMIATDRFGCAFTSPIVTAATLAEPLIGQRVIFEDALTEGVLWIGTSGTFAFNSDCDGNACLENFSVQTATQNLRVAELVSFTGDTFDMSESQFETSAMLEFRIWIETADPSFWTEIYIQTLEEVEGGAMYRVAPYTPIRTPSDPVQSSYWTVQVPLRTLRRDSTGEPLTYAEFTHPERGGLFQVSFGTLVPAGSREWWDDIRIRW